MDRKRRRVLMFRWVAAVFSFLLLATLAGLFLFNRSEPQTEAPVVKQSAPAGVQPGASAEQPAKSVNGESVSPEKAGTDYAGQGKPEVNSAGQPRSVSSGQPVQPKQVAIPEQDKSEDVAALTPVKRELLLPAPFGVRPYALPGFNIPVKPAVAELPAPAPFHARFGRLNLGFGLMQNLSGMAYTVNPEFSQYVHKNYLERMRSGESSLGAVQAGFMVSYRLTGRGPLSVFSGLNYMQRNTRQQFNFSDEVPVTLMPGKQPDKFGNYPIIGYLSPSGTISYSGFTRMTMFEIPVGLMYDHQFGRSRWSMIPMISANLGFITAESGNTLDYQLLTLVSRNPDWFRRTVINGSAGLGVYRELMPGLKLGATLNAAYTATPVYVPGATVRPRAWATGFGTQIIWRID